MKILIEVEEAAERLEELIDLALQQDEIYVCRGGRPVAQLTSFPGGDDTPSDEFAETLTEAGLTAAGELPR
jgi:antitoxin (DNA-binding transcriptional repressor) of toxin-antitoxin stability system